MKQSAVTTLTLANVSKRFGDIDAVKDVTLNIKSGEIVGFVGPNGAGKTTAISMIMGFLQPTRGSIKLLDTLITPQTAHETHRFVGYVAGDMVLPSTLTGAQYLTFVQSSSGRDEAFYTQLINRLDPTLDQPLHALSRGNRQKIALIAALQHAPKILILDEPTSGLDPLMQDVFLDTVRHAGDHGTTVLMSSHILNEVSSICSRIVFMKAGRFIVDKSIDEIASQLGKHVIVSSLDAHKLIPFLPTYATLLTSSNQDIELSLPTAELKPFLRWLVTKRFTDITIKDRDLDGVFHELYSNKTQRRRS